MYARDKQDSIDKECVRTPHLRESWSVRNNSFPLSQPAIHSLARAFRRHDLCSWSFHTQLQQTAILLGSILRELLRKYDKATYLD